LVRLPLRLVVIATLAGASGCGAILGFEDHEPYPDDGAGGTLTSSSSVSSSSSGAASSSTTSTGVGGAAGGGGAAPEPEVEVLLIPDSIEDAIGVYDPATGAYLGDFVPPKTGMEPWSFALPNNAVQGPDKRIYVSDQSSDAVFCFEQDGSFHGVFADDSDGLDNVRGIDFRDGELFVSLSPAGGQAVVARFSATGNRLADFINDSSDPFDIFFLDDSSMLLANVSSPDDVRRYNALGAFQATVVTTDFPQQIQQLPNGNLVAAGWDEYLEFALDGSVMRTVAVTNTKPGRGIYPLSNGFWLVASAGGVDVVNPNTEVVEQAIRATGSFHKIERAFLRELP
jgi:hypothetical protein